MGIHLLLEGAAGTLDERQQEILQVCREDTARLDRLMRRVARPVEDRVGRRDAAVRRRCARRRCSRGAVDAASTAGRGAAASDLERRCAAGPAARSPWIEARSNA